MWPWKQVRVRSKSLEMAPFDRSHTSSYSPFIVTMAVSLAISEIFSIKEWPDLEMWVWGCSRSLKMAWFDRPCMTDRIALSESHVSTLTRDKNCWMHYSSEQNVSRTSVSPARLRLVKYRRFWLLSGRREVGAEIRELPEKYRRSGNPTNKYVPLKKAASSREPKPMWITHKAYKAVKKKYRVFARYKDKLKPSRLRCRNIKSQKADQGRQKKFREETCC